MLNIILYVHCANIRTCLIEHVRALDKTSNGPPLELMFHCVVIPPEIPPERSSGLSKDALFEDAAEKEAFFHQCIIKARISGRIMMNEVLSILADLKYTGALQLSDEDGEKPLRLMHAGDLFFQAYQQSPRNADLDKAITAYDTATKLMPDGHERQAKLYLDLGTILLNRIKYFGDIGDIENAIFALEYSLTLTPDGHADKPGCLNNLGASFLHRFMHLGDLLDVDKAISAHEQAVHLTPDGHADKPGRLNNLGMSFLQRFTHLGDLLDVDMAISAHEQAVHLTPNGHAAKPMYLGSLGTSFSHHFEHSGDFIDVEKSISAHEQAVHLTPDGHADKPGRRGLPFLVTTTTNPFRLQ
jgi:tetratricopeptide (TPR) repeat protein